MATQITPIKGKATEEQIKKLKSEVEGKLFEIHADGYYGYLKMPNRSVMSMATIPGTSLVRKTEIILQNCWLTGDEEIQERDDLFYGLGMQIDKLIEAKEASVKKL